MPYLQKGGDRIAQRHAAPVPEPAASQGQRHQAVAVGVRRGRDQAVPGEDHEQRGAGHGADRDDGWDATGEQEVPHSRHGA